MRHSPHRPIFRVVAAVVLSGAAMIAALPATETGDRPLQILQTTQVRVRETFSTDLPSQGEVRVLILVDHQGQLRDLLLLGSSHFNYTQAAVEALQEWEFEPAQQQGQPVWVRNTVRLFFDARGRVVSVSGADAVSNFLNKPFQRDFASRLVPQAKLDASLRAVQIVRPRFPLQLAGKLNERASVVLDFYVDEEGRPRMPVAERSFHPYLTEAAMNALDQWRFTPPTTNDRPVVVRAKQEFVFVEEPDTPATAPAEGPSVPAGI